MRNKKILNKRADARRRVWKKKKNGEKNGEKNGKRVYVNARKLRDDDGLRENDSDNDYLREKRLIMFTTNTWYNNLHTEINNRNDQKARNDREESQREREREGEDDWRFHNWE